VTEYAPPTSPTLQALFARGEILQVGITSGTAPQRGYLDGRLVLLLADRPRRRGDRVRHVLLRHHPSHPRRLERRLLVSRVGREAEATLAERKTGRPAGGPGGAV